METYYYQIPEAGKAWDECIPTPVQFKTREEAIEYAKTLSRKFKCTIRWADNPHYAHNNGSYTTAHY